MRSGPGAAGAPSSKITLHIIHEHKASAHVALAIVEFFHLERNRGIRFNLQPIGHKRPKSTKHLRGSTHVVAAHEVAYGLDLDITIRCAGASSQSRLI